MGGLGLRLESGCWLVGTLVRWVGTLVRLVGTLVRWVERSVTRLGLESHFPIQCQYGEQHFPRGRRTTCSRDQTTWQGMR